MAEELWSTLLRFHREIAAPEVIGTLREEIASEVGSVRRETQANFDALWKRFDRLESSNEPVEVGAPSSTVER